MSRGSYNHSFPHAGTLLLYAMGYNIAESYFYNQPFLHWYNLLIADPLTTPFITRPTIEIITEEPHPLNIPVEIHAEHEDGIVELTLYKDGIIIAQSENGTLSWPPEGEEGDEFELFVVAKAGIKRQSPTNWPIEEIWISHATQGWIQHNLTLTAAEPDEPDEPEAPKTGCSTLPLYNLYLCLIPVLLSRRKRTSL